MMGVQRWLQVVFWMQLGTRSQLFLLFQHSKCSFNTKCVCTGLDTSMVINSGFSILDLCGRLFLFHFGGIQFSCCLLFCSPFLGRLLGLVSLGLCQGVANFPVISHSRFPSLLLLLLLLFLLFLLLHLLAYWWEPLAHSTLAYDAPTTISLTFS